MELKKDKKPNKNNQWMKKKTYRIYALVTIIAILSTSVIITSAIVF